MEASPSAVPAGRGGGDNLTEILQMEASVMPRLPLLLTFFKPEASTTVDRPLA
jgi:hypothetical protein